MIHTASLIHDDMPCMDDDALCCGALGSHVAFDEPTALLTGDALLAGSPSQPSTSPADRVLRAVAKLGSTVGVGGITAG
uniref:Uncharacterized protein n=1 Tax=Arundo donax TaxID=35708 RepID=A0A0A8ZDJ4_ARUDO